MKVLNHIQYFPTNVLSKIFSYIDEEDMCNNVPFVCEKWKIASSHSLLMTNARFKGKHVTSNDICFVLTNAPLLKSIALISVDDVVPVLRHLCRFYEIVALKRNITCIDISLNEFVTMNDLMMLVHNSKIAEFKISRWCKHRDISDQQMGHLVKMMKQNLILLHLDMSDLGSYTYNEIFCSSKLIDLKLNNATNLSAELLTKLPDSLKKIRHLKIEGPSILTKGDLKETVFRDFNLTRQLEKLKLEYLDSLGDSECSEILEMCCGLKALSLKGCKSLTVEGIHDPLLQITNLKFLNIAFLGKSTGVRTLIPLSKLNVLVIDEPSYEMNNLSALLPTDKQLQIRQLKIKHKKI